MLLAIQVARALPPRAARWAEALGRAFPEADELRALAARLPSVPGTAWAGLAAWTS